MAIKIVEVGPRDGLQNETKIISTPIKKKFVELLAAAGHKYIEIGAFVRADSVPQMADCEELTKQVSKRQGVVYSALVPNETGFKKAKASGIDAIAVFTSASETFNQKNTNATIDESFARMKAFLPAAKKAKLPIRAYLSTAFGCPYEGKVKDTEVLKICERLLKLGVQEISVCDTIGIAGPKDVEKLTPKLLEVVSTRKLAYHFHDTSGTALTNVYEAMQHGVRIFDSSTGGLGGCPFAPGASGNLATEDLLYMLHNLKVKTSIDLNKQIAAALFIEASLEKRLPGRYLQRKRVS